MYNLTVSIFKFTMHKAIDGHDDLIIKTIIHANILMILSVATN